MRRRVTVVALSVCVSVKSLWSVCSSWKYCHVLSGQQRSICGVFSETSLLPRSSTHSVKSHTYSQTIFPRIVCMRIICTRWRWGFCTSMHLFNLLCPQFFDISKLSCKWQLERCQSKVPLHTSAHECPQVYVHSVSFCMLACPFVIFWPLCQRESLLMEKFKYVNSGLTSMCPRQSVYPFLPLSHLTLYWISSLPF